MPDGANKLWAVTTVTATVLAISLSGCGEDRPQYPRLSQSNYDYTYWSGQFTLRQTLPYNTFVKVRNGAPVFASGAGSEAEKYPRIPLESVVTINSIIDRINDPKTERTVDWPRGRAWPNEVLFNPGSTEPQGFKIKSVKIIR